MDPFVPEEETAEHSPEPWSQEGRYIRDATGAIVVRGRSAADARRIVAAINGTRGIPTEALESWSVQDVSDPLTRPALEIDLDSEPEPSPHAVRPPDRRLAERRRAERREMSRETPLLDRRVFERRRGDRRESLAEPANPTR
jgi:hypothetical protein